MRHLNLGRWVSGGLVALAVILILMASMPVWAQQSSRGIVAIVNNSVISDYDLEQRIGLALVTSGLQRTPEIVEALRPQVLNRLIDDRIKLQEAGRYNVSVNEQELQAALRQLAQGNNMTFNDIQQVLSDNGVTIDSLRNQIVADLAWNRVLEGLFVPQVSLSQEEIELAFARAKEELAQPRYLVSEIVLRFDDSTQESVARENAYRLLEPLRTNTAFEPVAQQFSQSPTSANGGLIGWVVSGKLQREIDRVLPLLAPGEISDPIRTDDAYHIIKLQDKKEGNDADPRLDRLNLARAFLPLAANAPSELLNQANRLVQRFYNEFTDCVEGLVLANSIGADFQLLETVVFSQLPPTFQEEIDARGPNQLLPPSRTSEGVEIIAICGREQHRGTSVTRVDVERNLMEQEVELLGRRHLRDLRRQSLIELR